MKYRVFESLSRHQAHMKRAASLENGAGLAQWRNNHDRITLDRPGHHTLSLYVADGYESYRKSRTGWHNGGAPDRFCLMPAQLESTWDVRGPLEFAHLYFTDRHLSSLTERTWDKSPTTLRLDEQIFADDPLITSLYRHSLLGLNWHDKADRLALDTTATLLQIHVLRRYSCHHWSLPRPKGGLAPHRLKRLLDYIDAHLDQALPLAELAA